jgi:hypothetical protein
MWWMMVAPLFDVDGLMEEVGGKVASEVSVAA